MIQSELLLFEEIACTTTMSCDSMLGVGTISDTIPDDIEALKAALLAERVASSRRALREPRRWWRISS
jgi:hypothetical protein